MIDDLVESKVHPPASPVAAPVQQKKWEKIFSQTHQRDYFFNFETGQSVWTKPTDYTE